MFIKSIRTLWAGAMIFILLITLYAFDGKPNSDIGVFFAWCILALSFPGGLMVPLTHVALNDGLAISIDTSYLSLVLDWMGFFVLGYFHWFYVLPRLVVSCRAKR